MDDLERNLERAAAAIDRADALLIGAGAGMGVDSGLPDFRGPEGFWRAYQAFRGKPFHDVSNPVWFDRDPEQAWGFFGHRLHLYRNAEPHGGYAVLRRWCERPASGAFVFTSNVDGHFRKAGFDEARLFEVHGSIHHLQCVGQCSRAIWSADDVEVDVDVETVRATSELPTCPTCGGLARPNVLMFGDYEWIPDRSDEQERRYVEWRRTAEVRYVVAVEIGAGTAVPTVRSECAQAANRLVRINPRDADVPANGISIPLPAREALERIDELLG